MGASSIAERHVIVLYCTACAFISISDRVNISIAVVRMAERLSWDAMTQSLVLSSFYYGYIISQPFAMHAVGAVGAQATLSLAVSAWSLLTIATPFLAKTSLNAFIGARILMGLAEGFTYPVIFQIFGDFVPPQERSRAIGVLNTGALAGTVCTFWIAPQIILRFDWPAMFQLFGAIGLVWVLFWHQLNLLQSQEVNNRLRGTEGGKGVAEEEGMRMQSVMNLDDLQRVESEGALRTVEEEVIYRETRGLMSEQEGGVDSTNSDGSTPPITPSFGVTNTQVLSLALVVKLFSRGPFCAIVFAHWCNNFGQQILLIWTPTYFHSTFHIGMEKLSMTAYPYLVMAVSVNIGALLADHLHVSRGMSLTAVRKLLTAIGFVGSSILLLAFAFVSSSLELAVAVLCASLGLLSFAIAGYETNKLDIASSHYNGAIQAISNCVANTAGFVAIPLAAYMAESTGSWKGVMFMIACVFTASAAVYTAFGSAKQIFH
jgi:MFS family permease